MFVFNISILNSINHCVFLDVPLHVLSATLCKGKERDGAHHITPYLRSDPYAAKPGKSNRFGHAPHTNTDVEDRERGR